MNDKKKLSLRHPLPTFGIRIQTFSVKMPWINACSRNFQTLLRACTMGKKKEALSIGNGPVGVTYEGAQWLVKANSRKPETLIV